MTYKEYHRVITAIYQKKNPEKVNDVTMLLKKYAGNEKELLDSIVKKYDISVDEIMKLTQEVKRPVSTNNYNVPYDYTFTTVIILVVISILVLVFSIERNGNASATTNFQDSLGSVLTSETNTDSEILNDDNLKIEEFEFDNLSEHYPMELATETTNFALKDGNPNELVFIEAEKAYMKINGKYEVFKLENNNANKNGFESKYSNSKYEIYVNGKCVEIKNAIQEGISECKGGITVINKENNIEKSVSFKGTSY